MQNLTGEKLVENVRNAVLAELPYCLAIYVFGSRADDQARPDSDLDIAVLLPRMTQIDDKLAVLSHLAVELKVEVDLVDLRAASDVLRREVLVNGVCIHNAAPGEVLAWEAEAMTRYGHYRREVAGLLADFHDTGRGYRQ